MKKMMMVFVVLFAMVGSSLGGVVPNISISRIRARPFMAYVLFQGCGKYAQIPLDTEYGKAMYATLLNAFNNGHKVDVEFTNSDDCQSTESTLNYVEVYK